MMRSFSICALLLVGLLSAAVRADEVRVLPPGQLPEDVRLQPPKDLDGYFPFEVPESPAAWNRRAEEVRRQIQVALGLWPMPRKTELNLHRSQRHEFADYSVTAIRFESWPGFYVTGSLFEPVGQEGPFPGVLCPHGHWANGRFYDAGEAAARNQIEQGAESDIEAARNPIQARCVHLARMGCVVLQIDMLGYADSQQLSYELVHRFGKQRPEMNTDQHWGLFSPQAESHLQSVMGLQTWNCIRSLDLLESLPHVDSSRLGVTGASGGATQTMILAAIDPRVAVSFPAVMVSTAMQGGCTCENCSLLRIGTGNVEFAALFAPKPQGLTTADDWTIEFATKGFPELKRLYALLGAEQNVHLTDRTEFKHNFNKVSRQAMYKLFNDAFALDASIEEEPYQRLTEDELTVWSDESRPEYSPEFERDLLAYWTQDIRDQLVPLLSGGKEQFAEFRRIVDAAIPALVGADLPPQDSLHFETLGKERQEDFLLIRGRLTNSHNGSQLPLVFFYPEANWSGHSVLWLSSQGKEGLLNEEGDPQSDIAQLLSEGFAVAGVDLIYQGEFLGEGESLDQTPVVANPREAAAYTFGYNHSVAAQRIQDIVTAVAFMRQHQRAPESVGVVALEPEMAALAAVARAAHPKALDFAALTTTGFRFGQVDSIRHPALLPGGAKYGDIPAWLALGAPGPLWLTEGDQQSAEVVRHTYEQAGASAALVMGQEVTNPVHWIIRQVAKP